MSISQSSTVRASQPVKDYVTAIIIVAAIVIGYLLWYFWMGSPSNFIDNDPHGEPIEEGFGSYLALLYKGGYLVGTALGLLFITLTLSIERIITLGKASGKGSPDVFVQKIQMHLENEDLDGALAECDRQRGTVGNVVREAIVKYQLVKEDNTMNTEQKVGVIKQAVEEAYALELPMLEKHLTVIATIVSTATLVGLIGTVLGMIKAFKALGASGTPDAAALSVGISEALINTATGITTSTIATVAYNYFTSRVDDLTFRVDEVGITIVETFKAKHA